MSSALNLIVKTDVVGSVEALRDSLEQLSTEEVAVKVIHAAAGPVTVADVNLSLASEGLVVAFNIPVEPGAERLAELEHVEIRSYSIIYEVIEQVEAAISGLLQPVQMQVVDGHAEVLQVFPIRGLGNIAGCRSLDGSIRNDAQVHVYRNGEQIAESPISSLRRFQDTVQEVDAGQEFGVALARLRHLPRRGPARVLPHRDAVANRPGRRNPQCRSLNAGMIMARPARGNSARGQRPYGALSARGADGVDRMDRVNELLRGHDRRSGCARTQGSQTVVGCW